MEVDWRAASAPGANDGGLTLWVDDVQIVDLSGIDNDTRRIGRARLGAVAGVDNGTRSTYFFDEFESRRVSYIGPTSAPQMSLSIDGLSNGSIESLVQARTPKPGEDLGLPSNKELARIEREEKVRQERKVKPKEDVGMPSEREKGRLNRKEKSLQERPWRRGDDLGLPGR